MNWYRHLPKPQLITANITAPKITPIAEELKPDNLAIDFGYQTDKEFIAKAVAPIDLVNKEVTEHIELTPHVAGTWFWDGDHHLVFTPKADWPAGQTFTVKFNSAFFARGTKLERLSYTFTTSPFTAAITEFKFYQDPIDAKVRQAVATVEFNFPVNPESFEQKTSLLLQNIKNNKLNLAAKQFKWTVQYDEHKRRAYLHSETLPITDVERYVVLMIDKGVKAATGSSALSTSVSKNLLIPDASNYFKVLSSAATIVRNELDRTEQVLSFETTIGIADSQMNKALQVYLLPENYPATQWEAEKNNINGKILVR